jgi:hypothetical protein
MICRNLSQSLPERVICDKTFKETNVTITDVDTRAIVRRHSQ